MAKFIFKRILRGLIALVIFQSLLFILVTNLPYDFSVTAIGAGRSGRQFLREMFGLNKPVLEQLGNWLGNFFRGNLGESFAAWPTPVLDVLALRASRTLLLFLTATILAYILGIWLGKLVAWHRGGVIEFGLTLTGVAAFTSFAPWLGFLFLNVFSWYTNWFPYQHFINPNVWFQAPIRLDPLLGYIVTSAILAFGVIFFVHLRTRKMRDRKRRLVLMAGVNVLAAGVVWAWWAQSGLAYLAVDVLYHLVIPLLAVVALSFGDTMMLMRMAMIETSQEDFVITARAKGIGDKAVRDLHVARNAVFPVFTRLLLNLPFVLVGSFVIENVFNWRGMGTTLFQAIEVVDVPVIMGILSFIGVITLAAHVVMDISYYFLDPRLRYAEAV